MARGRGSGSVGGGPSGRGTSSNACGGGGGGALSGMGGGGVGGGVASKSVATRGGGGNGGGGGDEGGPAAAAPTRARGRCAGEGWLRFDMLRWYNADSTWNQPSCESNYGATDTAEPPQVPSSGTS